MENRINLNVDEENINIHIDETPTFTVEVNPVDDVIIELNEQGPAGPRGLRGETGNGIESFELTSSSGLTDTYTITFTDGNTQSINIENGRDAVISGASATVNNTVGTPTVNVITEGTPYDRSFVFEFENLKGEQGIQGIQGPVGPQGPQGPEGGTRSGMKGDYCTTYGIEYCQYGLITNPAGTKNITVKGGMMLCVPGAETKITIGSDINYTITSDGDVTIFYVDGNILEASKVYFSIAEPIETVDGYIAWWNPDHGKWQFKSNDTGNVWRDGNATPLADIRIDNGVINRIDYIGYRVLNDDIYGLKNEVATIDLDNLTEDGETHFLNKTQITNCLLEVPQNIKLELNDGALTLKAGSKVIVPNGFEADGTTPKFDEITINVDKSISSGWNDKRLVFFTHTGYLAHEQITHCYSGDTPSSSTYTYQMWYDTANNVVKYTGDNGVTWISGYSLPIGAVTTGDGAILSIDQIFNGFGYIGFTIWVDKGVKCLAPNGRNEDGSLKNVEITTNTVYTYTDRNRNNERFILLSNSGVRGTMMDVYYAQCEQPTTTRSGAGWINPETNMFKYYDSTTGQWVEDIVTLCGQYTLTNSDISNFQTKLPVQLVKYDELEDVEQNSLNKQQITNCLLEVPQNIKLELNNGTLTLKAGSVITIPNGANTFGYLTITGDKTNTQTTNGRYYVFALGNGSGIFLRDINRVESGSTRTLSSTYSAWYDTTNNRVMNYTSNATTSSGTASFPIALITVSNGAISSINQVFNGIGYIGSSVWVDKGVKCLIPNGRNLDGSLKNTEHTTPKVAVYANVHAWGGTHTLNITISTSNYLGGQDIVRFSENKEVVGTYTYSYNSEDNYWYYSADSGATWTKQNITILGTITETSTDKSVSDFSPKLPFRAVDYNDAVIKSDLSEAQVVVETYQNGTSWYRVWSADSTGYRWCEQGGQQVVDLGTDGSASVSYLKQYKDTNYSLSVTEYAPSAGGESAGRLSTSLPSKTGFIWVCDIFSGGSNIQRLYWNACGYIA